MAAGRRGEAFAGRALILFVLGIQVIAAALFLFNLMIPILGIPLILDWSVHEAIELVAATSLLAGVIMTVLLLRRMQRRAEHLESQLRAASGAFLELLEEKFDLWSLTPAERDVALFSIKGVSPQEIAALRNTSEGTVKAQTNAIYRKAGVSGRPQLLSLFIDDLMDGPLR
jgi:DNA-binding CsgD family transcriptional regulator